MKATIVLIANNEAENYGKKLMLEAHKAGNLGFEMARLPQHVSLKQPFSIPDLVQFEEFFDQFAKDIKPVAVKFKEVTIHPSKVLGYPSGCMSISAVKSVELTDIQNNLFWRLEERFGRCPAEHDDDYVFHMTIAIGGAPYVNYEKAFIEMKKKDYQKAFVFDRLGLLYYDDDSIKPGTYFCYKVAEI
ncbi:hypothetical protein Ana3638_17230 [Anaerocolumna sedimenticola]|uniref:2'-5' RNA ligase n=1 Tax=Anaerocolumna sedimenticola TaxID=2696063 RepID=A0A6P1TQ46_9FIRM|nr:2'-5' RNA ligase family protein [Anaerocolumna sedimenticola]QHQ62312.1 hypothetical protein Ana3638_17230 [Anaerocolumna sedimenticola]